MKNCNCAKEGNDKPAGEPEKWNMEKLVTILRNYGHSGLLEAINFSIAAAPTPDSKDAPEAGKPVAEIVPDLYGGAVVQWSTKPHDLPPGTKLYARPSAADGTRPTDSGGTED